MTKNANNLKNGEILRAIRDWEAFHVRKGDLYKTKNSNGSTIQVEPLVNTKQIFYIWVQHPHWHGENKDRSTEPLFERFA